MLTSLRKAPYLRPMIEWMHRLAPDRYVHVRVLRGALRGRPIELNLRYQMGYWLGLTEPDLQGVLATSIAPGDIIFDVGAEIGYFSLLTAVLAQTGHVYAFEPNPANLAILNKNVAVNPDLNLTVVPYAVGSERGEAAFLTFEEQRSVANASLLGRLAEASADSVSGQSVRVTVIDLDSFCEEWQVQPNLVKIDVEGAEASVLKGMAHLLMTCRPCLAIEVHHLDAFTDVTSHLTKHNYQWQEIGRTFESYYPVRLLCKPSQVSSEGSESIVN